MAALGLTFKAGTDDLRESPAIAIITELRRVGATVRAFDPTTTGELSPLQKTTLDGIDVESNALDAVSGADVVCVFTEWPEFAAVDLEELSRRVGAGTTIVDTRNLLAPDRVRAAGLSYEGVGRN